jgi:Rrf2 family iron-sulfur cluster assembly transcriptional regulator
MKLTTKGRYAVMAMTDLAGHSSGESTVKPVTLADIAARQDISLSYLEQLFSRLRKSGLVRSVRGPGGGYRLARPASEVRIADIMLAVNEPLRSVRCKPNSGVGCMADKSRCLTHDLWEELDNQIYIFLSKVSLEDVCARRVLGSGQSRLAQALAVS